jgi:hypothetical protein
MIIICAFIAVITTCAIFALAFGMHPVVDEKTARIVIRRRRDR